MPPCPRVIASAPGKVLVTGAYLILERPNAGLVLSTSARFFAVSEFLNDAAYQQTGEMRVLAGGRGGGKEEEGTGVVVQSPQLDREFRYSLNLDTYQLMMTTATMNSKYSSSAGNPYVEYAIKYAVAVAKLLRRQEDQANLLCQLQQGLKVTILGDNDFYSQQDKVSIVDGCTLSPPPVTMPRFASVSKRASSPMNLAAGAKPLAPDIKKTGLGSSAAMVTAVVTSILQLLNAVDLSVNKVAAPGEGRHAVKGEQEGSQTFTPIVANTAQRQGCNKEPAAESYLELHETRDLCMDKDNEQLDLIHKIAQAAHCAAQGKVGSGFDVSAAVYGSQRYIRFSPSALASLSARGDSCALSPLDGVASVLHVTWDEERKPFALPAGLQLILGESGAGGSSTPSMVGELQKWRKRQPDEARIIWMELAQANEDVEMGLRRLCHLSAAQGSAQFHMCLAKCAAAPANKWLYLDQPGVASTAQGDFATGQVAATLWETRAAFERVRSHLKKMGNLAGVPIEPDEQTALIEATISINGVLLAGVPGAGGYDAVFAIVLGISTKKRVEEEWRRSKSATPLPTNEGSAGVQLHDAREEIAGHFCY